MSGADRVYEIPNMFPFKGTTFINAAWADFNAQTPSAIRLPEPEENSLSKSITDWLREADQDKIDDLFSKLPNNVLLALATTSTDPEDLVRLARICCDFLFDERNMPTGLVYQKRPNGQVKAHIHNHPLFESVANNPYLPNPYKQAMVLRPGAQGGSEIIGEWVEEGHHVFEYLRRNSYIPWGHFASNMANDSVRYHIKELSAEDMLGLRHLYYQRTFVRLAQDLAIDRDNNTPLSPAQLEKLRLDIVRRLEQCTQPPPFDCTLWGWNYGFDFAPSHYRLNASHQQIHQQFAMLPSSLAAWQGGVKTDQSFTPFACGDLVEDCIKDYHRQHNRSFFADLITNIRNNRRMDGGEENASLIIYEDEQVILFVPKAQTSQWELQLLTLQPVGNILEADENTRRSLDLAMHRAMQILGSLGVKLVTTIEYSKRLCSPLDQRLMYSFLPKLPKSPGAFSETQLRWIMGHFPEDFAAACREHLPTMSYPSPE